jgi:hypothetical protein
MHAYLLIGEESQTTQKAKKLAKSLKAKILEFPLEKIEDVRQLNSFVGLSVGEPTVVFARNIHAATLEALNAFLKNLEEPQEGLYYILSAESPKALPETIVSRCQVIFSTTSYSLDPTLISQAQDFLQAPVGEKLAKLAEIRDRQEAKDFTNNLILSCHGLMLSQKDPTIYSRAIRSASFTRRALEANGNVIVQLANLAVSLV